MGCLWLVTNSKLANTTATAGNVLSGKTFYSGDKSLNTGTIASKAAESVILNASTTAKTFDTSGKYCTGNMTVSTNTKSAESKTFAPSDSAQSYTFATSGKLCTGDMKATVNGGSITITVAVSASLNNDFESNNDHDSKNRVDGGVSVSVNGGGGIFVHNLTIRNTNTDNWTETTKYL